MRKLIAIVLALCSGCSLHAQTNLDSLWRIWQDETQDDTTRLGALYRFTWNGYLFTQPDSAFYYAQQQYDFAESKGLRKEMASALNTQGVSFAIRDNYPKALDYYQKTLKIEEALGNKGGIANTLNNMGLVHYFQGNYPQALDYYQNSLAIREEQSDKEGISDALNNIGSIFLNQGNYPKALDYFLKSLEIEEQLSDKQGIANAMNNIGLIYNHQANYPLALEYYQKSLAIDRELGDQRGIATSLNNIGIIYKEQNNYPQALDHYQQSLEIRKQLGDKKGIASTLYNMGTIFNAQGNRPKALTYYRESLALREELGDKEGIANSLNSVGMVYKAQGKFAQAVAYCKNGLELAESLGVFQRQKDACECLYDTYKAMGKGNEALVYLEKLNAVNDSLQAEETNKKLQQMEFAKVMLADSLAKAEEARLVLEAHNEEIRQQEKLRNRAYVGGFIALLLAVGFYSRWRYVRRARDIISKEKDRSEHLLLNILPAEIAEELKEKGEASARDFDRVSILFTDFKGFTQASEKLSAADLVKEINTCFKAFDEIVGKYGIEKIKTIGDAYMAAGGLPVPDEHAARNTVLAGLEMQAFMTSRKAERDALGLPSFEMRVGIHTGPVVAGIVGVKKFQYDVWGDTVNIASRMESSGEVGKVNISETTFGLLKDDAHLTFESRGNIEAKGKGAIQMYFVSPTK